MTYHHDKGVSIRRRRVLLAGGAGALLPSLSLAVTDQTGIARNPFAGGDTLVLSGCLRDANGVPLAAARVAIGHTGGALGVATTDADGRFMLEAQAPAAGARLTLLVDGGRAIDLHFTRDPPQDATRGATRGINGLAQLERDTAGVWRAAVGITFA